MSPLRKRMIQDMHLAGLAVRTQGSYIAAVRSLAAYYRRSPELLREEQVRSYLIDLRERGIARLSSIIAMVFSFSIAIRWAVIGRYFLKKDSWAAAEAIASGTHR
jgi:hypothetical protein